MLHRSALYRAPTEHAGPRAVLEYGIFSLSSVLFTHRLRIQDRCQPTTVANQGCSWFTVAVDGQPKPMDSELTALPVGAPLRPMRTRVPRTPALFFFVW